MQNSIVDILKELLRISEDLLFQRLDILDITVSILKARLIIIPDLYIQIYANVRKAKCSYILIVGNHRFYGRDMINNEWHKHPVEAPEIHNESEDSSIPITMAELVQEAKEILIQRDLI